MPLFFFDINNGHEEIEDDCGTDLPDPERACLEAAAVLPNIARDASVQVEGTREFTVTVRDEVGHAVYRAVLSIAGRRIALPHSEFAHDTGRDKTVS